MVASAVRLDSGSASSHALKPLLEWLYMIYDLDQKTSTTTSGWTYQVGGTSISCKLAARHPHETTGEEALSLNTWLDKTPPRLSKESKLLEWGESF